LNKASLDIEDSAIQRWISQVSRHHEQSISAQEKFNPSIDFWKPYAHNFKDDPFRENDPAVLKLLEEFLDCETILDIGGGAGRLALPLALRKKAVTVVDSSESMLSELNTSASGANITNVESINALWEEVPENITIHDGAIISHVTYGIEDIERFVLNANRYTAKKILVLVFMESPQTYLGNIWEMVHSEARVHLPGALQLMDVLKDFGLRPQMEILENLEPHNYQSYDEALNDLRNRLYVTTDSPKDELLKSGLRDLLVSVSPSDDHLLELKGSEKRALCLIKWKFE
jgi:2-polyprenyl-3-methyl-5-hydroxy-6-metoxy-1,4-benzoquinol methylase